MTDVPPRAEPLREQLKLFARDVRLHLLAYRRPAAYSPTVTFTVTRRPRPAPQQETVHGRRTQP